MKSENPIQTFTRFTCWADFKIFKATFERKYENPKNSTESNYTL